MTIKELYEWTKENKSENLPISVRYWDNEEVNLSVIETDNITVIIYIDL